MTATPLRPTMWSSPGSSATDPAAAATSSVAYENIHRIDKLNDHTVKVVFKEPTPLGLTDGGAPVLPRHRFAEYKGANARNAPYKSPSRRWAQDIQAAVIADVRYHIGDQKVYDDITLVVAKQR